MPVTHDDDLPRSRGFYLLPNLFTLTALFAGFYAVVSALKGHFDNAAIAIFVAMIMDNLDGRIARLTHTQTAFGAEFDSLSDMVSFGVAPALVAYSWVLIHMGNIGWLAAFIYVSAAALRLARFNTQVGKVEKRYFHGLASPAAAAILASFVWVGKDWAWSGEALNICVLITTVLLGFLMVSNIPYRSFKDLDLRGKVPFVVILGLVLIYVLISIDPPEVLFFIAILYGLSGPVLMLTHWRKKYKVRKRLQRMKEKNK
jgi:CDP-diacylglycerol--serine O-phosphatidyltransferase